MTRRSSAPDTPKTVPEGPPRQHVPASLPWTLGMLFVILVAFIAVVMWYMR
jgi:hypothetical protein